MLKNKPFLVIVFLFLPLPLSSPVFILPLFSDSSLALYPLSSVSPLCFTVCDHSFLVILPFACSSSVSLFSLALHVFSQYLLPLTRPSLFLSLPKRSVISSSSVLLRSLLSSHYTLIYPTFHLLDSPDVSPHSAKLTTRRWGRRRHRRRTAAVLLWLCHALPHRLLEGPVRLRSSHRLHERLGLFHHLHHHHRPAHGYHWWPGVSLRLHDWPQGLGHGCGFCGSWYICPRWVQSTASSSRKHTYRKGRVIFNAWKLAMCKSVLDFLCIF